MTYILIIIGLFAYITVGSLVIGMGSAGVDITKDNEGVILLIVILWPLALTWDYVLTLVRWSKGWAVCQESGGDDRSGDFEREREAS